MRVVCDNCGATYKIPESKLTKEVNKATCRKCGHRMLIRRPVAASPVPVPPAGGDNEHTQIRRPPTPPADEWADDGPTRVARAPEDENDRPTVATEDPPPLAPVETAPPDPPTNPGLDASPPAPVVPAATTAPPLVRPSAPAPIASPVARATVPTASHAYDPSSDLTWAALGGLVSVAGALVLAFNITASPTLRTIGLSLALAGSLLSVFILLTGGRGLKRASVGLSVIFAALLGIGTATAIQSVFTQLYGTNESIELASTRSTPMPAQEAIDPADDDVLAALAEPDSVTEAPALEDAAAQTAAVVAAAPPPSASPPKPQPPARGQGADVAPARAAPPVEAPAPSRSEPVAAPAPEPAPKKQMTRLPTSVVETMIRNNKRIKRCWMEEKQRSGELPKRVDVKFTVQPSGAVSSARSATKKYRGTDFEVCLGAAFRSITFPPFDGEPLSMTYNFAL